MKLKHKLIFDFVIAIIFALCMNYTLTGGMLHELIGLALIIAFLFHVLINRKFYGAMIRGFSSGKLTTPKFKVAFVTNVILIITTIIMLVSSLAISQDVLPALSELVGFYAIWRAVHVFCAVTMAACLILHVCLHFSLFEKLVRKASGSASAESIWKVCSRVLAALMIVALLKANLDYVSKTVEMLAPPAEVQAQAQTSKSQTAESESQSETQTSESTQSTEIAKSEEAETEDDKSKSSESISQSDNSSSNNDQATITTQPADESKPTLTEYLGGLTCTACGKHCSLLSPRCGRGEAQASTATKAYYDEYGS